MIRFICALSSEAAPLNAYYGLSVLERTTAYTLFGAGTVQLLITGSGKKCVGRALMAFDSTRWGCAAWCNVGIAGSAEYHKGEVCEIARVSWGGAYPLRIHISGVELRTVDAPVDVYPSRGLVDMELWHIKALLGDDLCRCIKVVSDTPRDSFVRSKKEVKDLIRHSLEKIDIIVQKIIA